MAQRRILVFPGSPRIYMNLIYLAARSRGHDIMELYSLGSLKSQLYSSQPAELLHMHWTDRLFTGLGSKAEASEALDVFRDAIGVFRGHGGRVLWSVHGLESDDPTFAQEVQEASRFMLDAADVVHVTDPAMSMLLEQEHGRAAKRVVTVPQPSYQGIRAVRTRAEARAELGVDWTRRVILRLGPPRGSQGLDDLLAALGKLAADGNAPILLLSGRLEPGEPVAWPDGVEVIRAEDLATADVSILVAASDLCVTPTRWPVDSVSLGASLGVPVLMPGEGHLRAQFGGEPWVRFWDPNDAVGSLAAELASPPTYDRPAGEMRAWSEKHAPFRVSRQMADVFEQVCEAS